jgi:hypothetical protein
MYLGTTSNFKILVQSRNKVKLVVHFVVKVDTVCHAAPRLAPRAPQMAAEATPPFLGADAEAEAEVRRLLRARARRRALSCARAAGGAGGAVWRSADQVPALRGGAGLRAQPRAAGAAQPAWLAAVPAGRRGSGRAGGLVAPGRYSRPAERELQGRLGPPAAARRAAPLALPPRTGPQCAAPLPPPAPRTGGQVSWEDWFGSAPAELGGKRRRTAERAAERYLARERPAATTPRSGAPRAPSQLPSLRPRLLPSLLPSLLLGAACC